jgi:peptidyl-prolyl cis-trans isomerase C
MIAAEEPDPRGEAVATVNGEAISRVDLEREVIFMVQRFLEQGREVPENMDEALANEALDTLIDRAVLYQASMEKGYRVEPNAVDRELQSFRANFPDEESYLETLQQFRHTPESFRRDLERGLTIQKFINGEISSAIQITEEESRAFYEENPQYFLQTPGRVHVRHILIEVPLGVSEAGKAEAREEITSIRERLAQGEDFSVLARQHSQDPGSAPSGGDLGYIGRGETAPAFEEAAFDLEPGQLSGVVETEFGYHLIEVIDKTQEQIASFEAVKDTIAEYLVQIRTNETVDILVERLKSAATIEKRMPEEVSQQQIRVENAPPLSTALIL